MSVLNATRGSQYPLIAEFTFNFDDTMTNVSGVADGFATVATHVFDAINLPRGAVVLYGDVTTETAITGSTAYNVSVGDASSATRYLGVTDKVAAGRTALVPTGYVTTGEKVRVTVTPTVGAATAGKVTIRVAYAIRGRVNEVQTY